MGLWSHPDFIAARATLRRRFWRTFLLLCVIGVGALGVAYVIMEHGIVGIFAASCALTLVLLMLWENGIVFQPTTNLKSTLSATTESIKHTQETYVSLKQRKQEQSGNLSVSSDAIASEGAMSMVPQTESLPEPGELTQVHDAMRQPSFEVDGDADLHQWALNALNVPIENGAEEGDGGVTCDERVVLGFNELQEDDVQHISSSSQHKS